jgi:hypothetical protein
MSNERDYEEIMNKKRMINKHIKRGNIEDAERLLKGDTSPNSYI